MNSLPRIPTPAALQWREFRLRFVPVVVFGLALSTVVGMWRHYVSPAMLVGELETVQVAVKSPRAGSLTQLKVSRFQEVNAGDIVGEVITTDPSLINAALAENRAQVDYIKTSLEPIVNIERNKINFEQLSLSLLKEQIDLARAEVNLKYAEADLERMTKLFHDQVASDQEYDLAVRKRNNLQEEVAGIKTLVSRMEQEVKKVSPGATGQSGAVDPIRAAIELAEKKFQLTQAEMSPVILKAPMTGTVSMIHHQAGENVMAGETILTISGRSSDRIIGYLKPPLSFEPKVGMTATVTTRGVRRQETVTALLEVGSQLEPITNALLRTPHAPFEIGLPMIFAKPPQIKALPGELFDLRIPQSK